jgi:transcriptional regulator with XRE-family HTH domain
VIGQRLLRARKAAGLALRDLAERTCVNHTAISKFEKGLLTPFSVSPRLAQ